MFETEGADSAKPNLVLNFVTRKVARIGDLKRRCYERNGMRQVAETRKGCVQRPCDCVTPCGYRYFPGVQRLRDLQMSDCEALMNRVYDPEAIRQFAWWTEQCQQENARMRRLGLLRKSDTMVLGRIPGVLVRGLCHDFPEEFSTAAGCSVDVQEKNLERVLGSLFINRAHTARTVAL